MTIFPHFDSGAFKATVDAAWANHAFYNSGIKWVFNDDPMHRDFGKMEVKILLLDKAYSAGLRRWVRRCPDAPPLPGCGVVSKQCVCSPMSIFISHLQQPDNAKELSRIMKDAIDLGATLCAKNLDHVIKLHSDFAGLFAQRIRRLKNSDDPANSLSFFSKYLWFHAGIFPVLDSLARGGLRKLQGRAAPRYDNYADYAKDIFALLRLAFDKDEFDPDEVKKLDCFLVEVGSGHVTL